MYLLGMFAIGLMFMVFGHYETRPVWYWIDWTMGIIGILPLSILLILGTIMLFLLFLQSRNGGLEQPPEDDDL